MRPIYFYKGKASMALRHVPYAEGDGEDKKPMPSCVMMSLANSTGTRKYDTDNAKVIALTFHDVIRLRRAITEDFPTNSVDFKEPRPSVRFIHKFKETTKIFQMGHGQHEGTYGVYLKVGNDSTSIYLDKYELESFALYLDVCLPKMITE